MNVKLIKTEAEYEIALERLDEVFDAPAETPEGDEAELLMLLIQKYEAEHHPIAPPDPIEAIKFRMEQMGLDLNDLAEILKYRSRVSEILNRKRKLNLDMIRKLSQKLHIPAEVLIQEY